MHYSILANGEHRSVAVIFSDGHNAVLPDSDPNYGPLVAALRNGEHDETVLRRMSQPGQAVREFVANHKRVSMDEAGKIYFDGEKIKGRIAKHLRRMFRQDDPKLDSLVQFLTKLASNPSEHSREALYRWLDDRDFTITEDGDVIGYKGLNATGQSIMSGTAWVNGVKIEGNIPNPIGAVITMERDMVNPDRFATCSWGLHVGTWDYASSFANGMTVTVKVNPADVVMVPDDCGGQKMRVCRYTVLSSAVQEYRLPVMHDPDDTDPLPEPSDDDEPENEYDGDYAFA